LPFNTPEKEKRPEGAEKILILKLIKRRRLLNFVRCKIHSADLVGYVVRDCYSGWHIAGAVGLGKAWPTLL
jgi:hypothetical protein